MKKKLLAVLLVLVMVLSMLPHTVFAADGNDVVARINDTTYTDLQEAFDAAQEGDTVELLDDVELSAQLTISHQGTFDLGGHTLTLANISYAFQIYKYPENNIVTIKNGTIIGSNDYAIIVYEDVTFEDCKINFVNMNSAQLWGILNVGTLTLGEGTEVSISGSGAGIAAVVPYSGNNGTVIDGATITATSTTGDSYGVYMWYGGTTEFKSGTITGNSLTKAVLIGDESEFKMTGGTIKDCYYGFNIVEHATVNMTGGEIIDTQIGFIDNGTDLTQYTTINIGGDAKVVTTSACIYQPNNGEINISDNAYLEGTSVIGIKSGTLNISGGTLRAVDEYEQDPGVRASGINLDGSTIVIDDQGGNYYGNIEVNISGGELISDNGHNVSVTRATDDNPPVVTVSGGTFNSAENTFRKTSTNNAENAIITASAGTVLKGGAADLSVEFSDDDHNDAGYLAGDYLTVDRSTGDIRNIKVNVVDAYGGTVIATPEALSADSDTFTLTAVPQSADYTLVSITVTDADGKYVTVTEDGTQAGDGNGCITVAGGNGAYTVTTHCDITVTALFISGENNTVIEQPVVSVDASNVDGIEDEHLEDTSVTLPQSELENIVNEVNSSTNMDDARQALEDAGILAPGSGDDVYLQIATEIKVVVLAYDDAPNTPNILQLEITPYYHVFATTSPTTPVTIGEEKGEDFVLLSSSEYRISGTNLNITMTIPLTESFAGEGALISIEHEHTDYNDTVHHYFASARVKADGTITFRNRHGFSVFTFMVDTAACLDDLQVRDSATETVYPLEPEFDKDTLEYVAEVPNSVESVQVQPTVDAENIIITVNGVVVTSSDWSGDIPLQVGKNVITVKVSDGDAASGLYDTEYTIIIYRAAEELPENPETPQNPEDPEDQEDSEDPEAPENTDSTDTSDTPSNPNGSDRSPQTGNNNQVGSWLILLILSAIALFGVEFFNRKRKSFSTNGR